MTKKEITELVKICDCPEIQKLWKPKIGDEYFWVIVRLIIDCEADAKNIKEGAIWLPHIEDCIRLMGDRLLYIQRGRKGEYFCEVLLGLVTLRKPHKSARIACLKALKALKSILQPNDQ